MKSCPPGASAINVHDGVTAAGLGKMMRERARAASQQPAKSNADGLLRQGLGFRVSGLGFRV